MNEGISFKLKRRIMLFIALFVGLTVAISIRLGYVQLVMAKELYLKAHDQQTRDRAISPTRGNIYDRNMTILAKSGSVATIGVVHAQIKDPERVAKVLSEHLNMDYDKVYKKVTKIVAFERIATKVDKATADEIRALNLPGVKVDEDSKRYYPFNTLASQTIGFVGKDNQGIVGLEVKYDKYLQGKKGNILMETTGRGERRMDQVEERIDPVNGYHLVTTIDVILQQYAEELIERAVKMKQAKRGAIIMLNPQNGEIYALAIKPDYNLNEPFTINDETLASTWNTYTVKEQQNFLNQMWRNFTINDTYEPGSTFKVLTSAMGLEEGVVNENSTFVCTGSRTVGGRIIKCWRSPRSHGPETFVQGVQNSCNPVFMEVGERVGASTFYDYMVKFGLNKKTNIDLPGEAKGILHPKDQIGPVDLATMSFGQSFQITPMELLSAEAAAVNGGRKITPHFGKYIVDDDNNIVEELDFGDGEQIISKNTSDRLKKILETVVSVGGGKKAYIPGYHLGGKTATAQKLPRGSGKYVSSFMSFAPASNPVVMSLVIIDEPKGTYYGGQIATPIMKELYENALPYLGVKPDYTEEDKKIEEIQEVVVPDFKGLTIAEAKKLAHEQGINLEIQEGGEKITSQFPSKGEKVNKTSKIILYTK